MKKITFALLALVFLMASCTTAKYSGMQMTKTIPSYTSVGEFETTVSVHEFLGSAGGANLFNVTAENMDTPVFDAIQREISKFSGDAAVNIEITQQASFLNLILNGFSFGLYAPATVKITGTIVKYGE